jgi:hypothetical protein
VHAADFAFLGPDDVVGVFEGVQRVEHEHRVVAADPAGLLQLGCRAEDEERVPAIAVGDAAVIEADAVLVCAVYLATNASRTSSE